uniref:Uncharacterized protein n=1 Tax=Arundo donax TaxID=35708 RepID=A0A0A9BTE1_ARUDO
MKEIAMIDHHCRFGVP